MLRLKKLAGNVGKDGGDLMDVDPAVNSDEENLTTNGHFEMNGYQNGISSDEENSHNHKNGLFIKSNSSAKPNSDELSLMHCFRLEDFLINSLK